MPGPFTTPPAHAAMEHGLGHRPRQRRSVDRRPGREDQTCSAACSARPSSTSSAPRWRPAGRRPAVLPAAHRGHATIGARSLQDSSLAAADQGEHRHQAPARQHLPDAGVHGRGQRLLQRRTAAVQRHPTATARIATDPSTWLHNPVTGKLLVDIDSRRDAAVHRRRQLPRQHHGAGRHRGQRQADGRRRPTTTPSGATAATTTSTAATATTSCSAAPATTPSRTARATTSSTATRATTPSSAATAIDTIFGGDGNDYIDGGRGDRRHHRRPGQRHHHRRRRLRRADRRTRATTGSRAAAARAT